MWIMWIKKWIHKNGSYGKCAGIQKIRDIKENGIRKWICVMLTKKSTFDG